MLFGVSVTTFVGQNFGAQKYDRIRQSVWVCMGMSVKLTGAMSALVITFRPFILGIYTTDPAGSGWGRMLWRGRCRSTCCSCRWRYSPEPCGAPDVGASYGHHLRMRVRVPGWWIFTVVRTWHRIELLAVCYPLSWLLAATVIFFDRIFSGRLAAGTSRSAAWNRKYGYRRKE